MKSKKPILIALIALAAAAAIGFACWRLHETNVRKAMYQAILDAWSESDSPDAPAYLNAIDARTHFELEDIEKGEPYVVTVTVYGVDLGGLLRETDPEEFPTTQNEWIINDYLTGLVAESEPLVVQTFVYAWPEDGSYRIQFTETFLDAMTGRVYSYTLDLVNEMTGGTP